MGWSCSSAEVHLPVDFRGTEVRLERYWGDEHASCLDAAPSPTAHKYAPWVSLDNRCLQVSQLTTHKSTLMTSDFSSIQAWGGSSDRPSWPSLFHITSRHVVRTLPAWSWWYIGPVVVGNVGDNSVSGYRLHASETEQWDDATHICYLWQVHSSC